MLYSGLCRLVSENPVVETQPYFFQVLEVQGMHISINTLYSPLHTCTTDVSE